MLYWNGNAGLIDVETVFTDRPPAPRMLDRKLYVQVTFRKHTAPGEPTPRGSVRILGPFFTEKAAAAAITDAIQQHGLVNANVAHDLGLINLADLAAKEA